MGNGGLCTHFQNFCFASTNMDMNAHRYKEQGRPIIGCNQPNDKGKSPIRSSFSCRILFGVYQSRQPDAK